MRLIDAHTHLWNEDGYVDALLRAMDDCGVERACVSGLGDLFDMMDNDAVAAACRAHPDRLIGQVYVRPGVDRPDRIDRARDEGFRMVKVTLPRGPYDAPEFHPLWERAQALSLPVLFHTGVVTTACEAPGEGISAWHMHPMRIEAITREFPELRVIVAHLGIHWNDDAAEVIRMRPLAWADLSGEPGGWRARADAVGFDHWLWWPRAWRKVVFASDVHHSKLARVVDEDRERFERLGVGEADRRAYFAGNILEILGEDA